MAAELPLGLPWPKDNRLESLRSTGSFHAYVHIPFCKVRCGYCDFNTYTASEIGEVRQTDFHRSLISEIEFSSEVVQLSGFQTGALQSVFFGGGTPSLFTASQLEEILTSLKTIHGLAQDVEVTLEANPDTVTPDYLETLGTIGVNRISFGVQSFDAQVLKTLDRTHDPSRVVDVVSWAKRAGLRVSIDLIFGAPGESFESWTHTVTKAIELGTEHISAYSLIVEAGTKLAAQISRGVYQAVDEDLNAQKYEYASRLFAEAGLIWYEVSNWGVPSIHNQAYWYSRNWWGYGPGAHSHINGNRFWNKKHPLAYQQALAFGSPAQGIEHIDHRTHLEERLMLELRCSSGTELALIRELGISQEKVSSAIARGLLRILPEGRIATSAPGRLLIDGIVLDLLS